MVLGPEGGDFRRSVTSSHMEALDELAEALRRRLIERARAGERGRRVRSRPRCARWSSARRPRCREAERDELAARVVRLATGLGPLEPLLADPRSTR